MLRAVIFDFDGVITDSEILHLRAFNQVLAKHDIEIATEDYYKDYLGFNDLDCFKMLVDTGRLRLDEEQIQKLIQQKNEIFKGLAKTEATIIEGVHDFLDMLRQNEIPMAICSGAVLEEIELILQQANLGAHFEVIVSGEQVKKGKPSPEGFLLALHRLNKNSEEPILPSQCVVIEDSHWGLEAGNAAGMHTVGITNTYEVGQLGMAEKNIGRLSELGISDLQELCA
ncbi:MAG TPA: HAD family phosphatase [Sedimentisphaerales bacterium]|nr:HAD family phosphatase [Sedimentisphaerales bacterium]